MERLAASQPPLPPSPVEPDCAGPALAPRSPFLNVQVSLGHFHVTSRDWNSCTLGDTQLQEKLHHAHILVSYLMMK